MPVINCYADLLSKENSFLKIHLSKKQIQKLREGTSDFILLFQGYEIRARLNLIDNGDSGYLMCSLPNSIQKMFQVESRVPLQFSFAVGSSRLNLRVLSHDEEEILLSHSELVKRCEIAVFKNEQKKLDGVASKNWEKFAQKKAETEAKLKAETNQAAKKEDKAENLSNDKKVKGGNSASSVSKSSGLGSKSQNNNLSSVPTLVILKLDQSIISDSAIRLFIPQSLLPFFDRYSIKFSNSDDCFPVRYVNVLGSAQVLRNGDDNFLECRFPKQIIRSLKIRTEVSSCGLNFTPDFNQKCLVASYVAPNELVVSKAVPKKEVPSHKLNVISDKELGVDIPAKIVLDPKHCIVSFEEPAKNKGAAVQSVSSSSYNPGKGVVMRFPPLEYFNEERHLAERKGLSWLVVRIRPKDYGFFKFRLSSDELWGDKKITAYLHGNFEGSLRIYDSCSRSWYVVCEFESKQVMDLSKKLMSMFLQFYYVNGKWFVSPVKAPKPKNHLRKGGRGSEKNGHAPKDSKGYMRMPSDFYKHDIPLYL